MLKIGEFSTIAGYMMLLRHYDDLDLFKPHFVDPENGYRYYNIDQLSDLNRILALRDLGFSLDQIGRLVKDNINPDEIQGMLKLKQAQIEQDIAEEQTRAAACCLTIEANTTARDGRYLRSSHKNASHTTLPVHPRIYTLYSPVRLVILPGSRCNPRAPGPGCQLLHGYIS